LEYPGIGVADMKPVQYFSDEYLEQCKSATPEQVLEFPGQYRLMQACLDGSE
jgi:hypothetical protein